MPDKALVIVLLFYTVLSGALRCDNGERPYPPSSCLTISTSPAPASDPCVSGQLVTIDDEEQYDTLSRYIIVFGGGRYWTGYSYNDSGALVDSSNQTPPTGSPVLDQGRYLESTLGNSSGVCVAMTTAGGEAALVRMLCSDNAKPVCSESISTPSVEVVSSGPRVVSPGGSLTLTCQGSGEVSWRRDGQLLPPNDPGVTIDTQARTLQVVAFDGETSSYECVGGNRAGAAVSQALVLQSSGAEGDVPTVSLNSTATAVRFGTAVSLSCDHATPTGVISLVEWFVNGELIRVNDGNVGAESQLVIESFSQDGVYQCRAWTDNNDNKVESLFLSGLAGVPGAVSSPLALPDTMTSLFLSWTPPTPLNVLDPLLLRYDLHYSLGSELDTDASQELGINPLLLGGAISDQGITEFILEGLNPGTLYSVTIRAASVTSSGPLTGDRAVVTTYGTVPEDSVDNLVVRRTRDNKTLVADWADYSAPLPVGQVAIYHAQYRDSGKDEAINSVVLDRKYSYLVVSPVVNAQNYQVRVQVGVITERAPLTYSYGPFSKWVEVQGITDFVPPPPPVGLLPASSVIAAAIATPVLIALLVVAVLVLGLACYCVKSKIKTGGYSVRKRMDSQAESLKPAASELAAVV